jgi:Xaa-Pro dipeptidase
MERSGGNFGRHRKIMPFVPDGLLPPTDEMAQFEQQAREKAASLNQHVLGFGAIAEAEWRAAGIADPDLPRMRRYRLDRIRAELARRDLAGVIVFDPINIRYATDSTNMQLWVTHNATRFCFVAADGPVILYDYHHCEHLSDHSGVVDEVRPCVSTIFLYAGELIPQRIDRWADEVAGLLREHGGVASGGTLQRQDADLHPTDPAGARGSLHHRGVARGTVVVHLGASLPPT